MFNITRCLLLIITFSMVSCARPQQTNLPLPKEKVLELTSDTTLALVLRDSDGDVAPFCTATWVSPTDILTAAHCVEGAMLMSVPRSERSEIAASIDDTSKIGFEMKFITNKEENGMYEEPSGMHSAKVVKFDKLHDLALLTASPTEVKNHKFAKLANLDPKVDDVVYVYGHPAGIYWTYMTGFVSGLREDIKVAEIKGPFIQITANIFNGVSGASVRNSQGEIIGVVSFTLRAPNQGFAIHLKSIKQFIKNEDMQ